MPRSRSLTRFTMRVGLLHRGQSVLLLVSMTFLRSPVFATLAIKAHLLKKSRFSSLHESRGNPLRPARSYAALYSVATSDSFWDATIPAARESVHCHN